MANVFAFLSDWNGRLHKAFAPTQLYDAVAAAQRLIADGVINGHEKEDLRYQQFFISLDRFNSSGYAEAIAAFDVLVAAGCESAADFRNSKGAEIMGYQHFHGKDYLPYVIEHAVAYMNGFDGAFRHMARYAENARDGCDHRGTRGAVEFLSDLRVNDWGAICLSEKLLDAGIPPDNTVRAWVRNPEISQILQGDLRMYRAAYLAENDRRKEAYELYTEAVAAGVSPRVDRDIWYRNMFAPVAHAG